MKDSRLPWFKCIPSMLLGALSGMEPHEGYVYVVVLLRIYEIGGPCPDADAALARRTGYSVARVRNALELLLASGKLRRDQAGLVNPFAEVILEDRESSRNESKVTGKKGAKKRWEKTSKNQRNDDGEPHLSGIVSDADLELRGTEVRKKEEGSDRDLSVASSGESGWPLDCWDQFWDPYPHKVGKAAAVKAFARARRTGVSWDVFIAGSHAYVDKRDDRPWCNPATWLNQERWNDQPAQRPARGQRTGAGGFAAVARALGEQERNVKSEGDER